MFTSSISSSKTILNLNGSPSPYMKLNLETKTSEFEDDTILHELFGDEGFEFNDDSNKLLLKMYICSYVLLKSSYGFASNGDLFKSQADSMSKLSGSILQAMNNPSYSDMVPKKEQEEEVL